MVQEEMGGNSRNNRTIEKKFLIVVHCSSGKFVMCIYSGGSHVNMLILEIRV